jgi:hypothetical protein
MNNNRVHETLTNEKLLYIKSLLAEVQNSMPFLLGLSPAERMSLPKINVSNKAFTEDALNALRNNSAMFPSFMTVDMMERDVTLFAQLDEISTICRQLCEKVEDTRMVAGSEAFTTALGIYRIAEAASIAGMPGSKVVYQHLRDRFRNTRSTGTDTGGATDDTPTSEVGGPTL